MEKTYMRKFRFGMQRLLDLRSRSEDQARYRLADSQRRTVLEQSTLTAHEQACLSAVNQSKILEQRYGGHELLAQSLHLTHLRQQVVAQRELVRECIQLEAKQRNELMAAARDREVLDRLKTQRWQEYVTTCERIQQ